MTEERQRPTIDDAVKSALLGYAKAYENRTGFETPEVVENYESGMANTDAEGNPIWTEKAAQYATLNHRERRASEAAEAYNTLDHYEAIKALYGPLERVKGKPEKDPTVDFYKDMLLNMRLPENASDKLKMLKSAAGLAHTIEMAQKGKDSATLRQIALMVTSRDPSEAAYMKYGFSHGGPDAGLGAVMDIYKAQLLRISDAVGDEEVVTAIDASLKAPDAEHRDNYSFGAALYAKYGEISKKVKAAREAEAARQAERR